jgi:hypothetical protein
MSGSERARIELRLRDLSQLFNSLDPSPFVDRDLDGNAHEFIVSWAREFPVGRDLELRIHLATQPDTGKADSVQDAVRHYFAYQSDMKRKALRQLLRQGRMSLAVGLVFLTACMMLAEFVLTRGGGPGGFPEILASGLTIVGWVAMWRPLEIYLYEWWPLWEDLRHLDRLARMRVKIHMPQGGGTGTTAS